MKKLKRNLGVPTSSFIRYLAIKLRKIQKRFAKVENREIAIKCHISQMRALIRCLVTELTLHDINYSTNCSCNTHADN